MNEHNAKPCAECGMPCRPGEFHPYAACLMFQACHNSETVRANLAALVPVAPVKPEAVPQPQPAQAARAIEIADQQMFIALESYGIKLDKHGTTFGLCNAVHGEAGGLAEACDELREAVEWLVLREFVEIATDENSEHVVVLRRPDE